MFQGTKKNIFGINLNWTGKLGLFTNRRVFDKQNKYINVDFEYLFLFFYDMLVIISSINSNFALVFSSEYIIITFIIPHIFSNLLTIPNYYGELVMPI